MTPDKIVLLIIDASGGILRGKTLLQKKAYFLARLMRLDLGYKAHYYGPYSPDLEAGLQKAKALGFVDERVLGFGFDNVGFEMRRCDFVLTEDGKIIVNYLKTKRPDETQKISECLHLISQAADNGDDYVSLSIAAKTFHILTKKKQAMTKDDILAEAKSFDWNIKKDEINRAAIFLEKLNLIQTR